MISDAMKMLPEFILVDEHSGRTINKSKIISVYPCTTEGQQKTHLTFDIDAAGKVEKIDVPCQLLEKQIAREMMPHVIHHIMEIVGQNEEAAEAMQGGQEGEGKPRFHIPEDFHASGGKRRRS